MRIGELCFSQATVLTDQPLQDSDAAELGMASGWQAAKRMIGNSAEGACSDMQRPSAEGAGAENASEEIAPLEQLKAEMQPPSAHSGSPVSNWPVVVIRLFVQIGHRGGLHKEGGRGNARPHAGEMASNVYGNMLAT